MHVIDNLILKTPAPLESEWSLFSNYNSPFAKEIKKDYVINAIKIVGWYYNEWQRWSENPDREVEEVAYRIWNWLQSKSKNEQSKWHSRRDIISRNGGPLKNYEVQTVQHGANIGKDQLLEDAINFLILKDERPIEVGKTRTGTLKIRVKMGVEVSPNCH